MLTYLRHFCETIVNLWEVPHRNPDTPFPSWQFPLPFQLLHLIMGRTIELSERSGSLQTCMHKKQVTWSTHVEVKWTCYLYSLKKASRDTRQSQVQIFILFPMLHTCSMELLTLILRGTTNSLMLVTSLAKAGQPIISKNGWHDRPSLPSGWLFRAGTFNHFNPRDSLVGQNTHLF